MKYDSRHRRRLVRLIRLLQSTLPGDALLVYSTKQLLFMTDQEVLHAFYSLAETWQDEFLEEVQGATAADAQSALWSTIALA